MSDNTTSPDDDPYGYFGAQTPTRPGEPAQTWQQAPAPWQQAPYTQPTAHQPGQAPPGYYPQPARSRRWGKAGGGAAAGAGVAAKAGLLTKFFLLFKGAAILVKFKFAASMAFALLAYTWIYGWAFAVGLIALLAVHEFGHVAAFRMQGVKASLPTFIPFLGAYVKAESPVQSMGHGAAAALAGPAAGVVAALAFFELSNVFDSPLLQVLGYAGFFLSFINLMPLWILDGAKVARVLHWGVFFGALAVGLVVEIARPTRILPFLIIIGAIALFERWHHRARYAADYQATPPAVRSWLGAGYVCVALICLWGINVTYIPRCSDRFDDTPAAAISCRAATPSSSVTGTVRSPNTAVR